MSEYHNTPVKADPIIVDAEVTPLTPEQLAADEQARRELGESIMANRHAEEQERKRRTEEINRRGLERDDKARAEMENRQHWEGVHRRQAEEKKQKEFREMALEAIQLNVKLAAILRGGLNGCEVEVNLLRSSIDAIDQAMKA